MFAIMAALHHREPHRQGQFVDLAMYEAMMTLIPEAVIDLTLNDADPQRAGNRDRQKAPHGIYPCRETDTWVAISVEDEPRLVGVMPAAGHGEWLGDARFGDAGSRLANVGALDARGRRLDASGQRRRRWTTAGGRRGGRSGAALR